VLAVVTVQPCPCKSAFGSTRRWWVLAAILALGVILLLTIDPLFGLTSPDGARYGSEPTPVVAARALMVVVAGCDVFVALGFRTVTVCRQLGRLGVVILTSASPCSC